MKSKEHHYLYFPNNWDRLSSFGGFRISENPWLLEQLLEQPTRIADAGACLCERGSAMLMIDSQRVTMTSGTLCVATPQRAIYVLEASDDFDGYIIGCGIDQLSTITRYQVQAFAFFEKHCAVKLSQTQYPCMQLLCRTISEYFRHHEHPFFAEIIQSLGLAFMTELLSISQDGKTYIQPKVGRKQIHYYNFVNLLKTQYQSERRVDYYAGKLCISTTYLNEVCHSITGMSVMGCIQEYTMEQIRLRLQTTDESIQQISDLFHFPSASAFIRFFKKHEGRTPHQYRILGGLEE